MRSSSSAPPPVYAPPDSRCASSSGQRPPGGARGAQRPGAGGRRGAVAAPGGVGACEAVGVTFDCQACGACCCNTDENRAEKYVDYVEVGPRSALARRPDLLKTLTVVNDLGERHMKLRGAEQRCAALAGRVGVNVTCTIYALRPSGCRRVEPGSREGRPDQREGGTDRWPPDRR